MKIIVFSDSHGSVQPMLDAVFDENPDMILHLGDLARDCIRVRQTYPDIVLRTIRGNCDGSAPADGDEFVTQGKRIFMTHGHLYGVKFGLGGVLNAAYVRSADVLLFGHTHMPLHETLDGLLVVNPGSIGMGKKTYAVLSIEHGAVDCRIVGYKR
jgi:putative phosphoesterase